MRTSVSLHLQKGVIIVKRRRIGILSGDINFEEFEQMSNNHPMERFLLGIMRCSDNMKSMRSFGILTLMPFRSGAEPQAWL